MDSVYRYVLIFETAVHDSIGRAVLGMLSYCLLERELILILGGLHG